MTLRPGSTIAEIPASAMSNALAAGDIYARERELGVATKQRGASRFGDMQIKNTTGANLPVGSVLEISTSLFTESKPRAKWFEGIEPTVPTLWPAVLLFPTPADKILDAKLHGVVSALVNVTDTSHESCYVKQGETVLQSTESGPIQILFKPTGTGELTCDVLLQPGAVAMWRFSLTEDMGATTTNEATGDLKTMDGTDTTSDVQFKDPEGIFGVLVSGSTGYARQQGKQFYIDQANCPAS